MESGSYELVHSRKSSNVLCMLEKREQKNFHIPRKAVEGPWWIS